MHTTTSVEFKPINLGRWVVWGLTAAVLLLLPMYFNKGFSLTLLSQMGITIIFALSYNMLLGQSGMLSFGHAVYSGLGAFFAIHAMRWVGAGALSWPTSLLPLIGGAAGALFGVIFGYLTTRRAGTPFAMITLGIGEMVFAASLMFPGFFGGEGGITADRAAGAPFLGIAGITFGPQIQVYYLIAVWCLASMVAMYALTQTPLGRIANAVRDNPERAEFIGYNTQRVRWLMLILSSFFAGIAGALSAINFEIVSAENVSAIRSGGVLLAVVIGGATFFFGPILGAVVFVFFAVALSEYTKAWQLYLGVSFALLVMFAPGGLSSVLLMNLRVLKFGKFRQLRDPYVGLLIALLALALGIVLTIELMYHVTLNVGQGPTVRLFGMVFDTARAPGWVFALTLVAAASVAFEFYRRRFKQQWDQVQVEIEDWIRDNP
ncbi:MAG: branched-chain amino acid ABC transporter permease [Burkholderiaceae bacterium]|nr:branched-chain amino acid ABC transporter permease [Burkholderiaceae bacterium]